MSEENIVILGAGYGGLKVTQKLSELLGKHKEHPIMAFNSIFRTYQGFPRSLKCFKMSSKTCGKGAVNSRYSPLEG
ncbi:hypothetical protein SAMN02745133_00209 [Desulforamulus putei DSM 12395]|uniref:Uncharacterized protein n=1 Tax=Desulforamulus putei DSM 12395 TaxID=1121429 RepID=A0A1M4SRB3_9FIRM|nr:hypothetical protein SAMN02745133_00209 [Desulforamulus putei DSM 12395]